MASMIVVNTGTDYHLMPDGTKPLPEPMLTYHQLEHVTFVWGHYHQKICRYQSVKQNLILHPDLSRDQWISKISQSYFASQETLFNHIVKIFVHTCQVMKKMNRIVIIVFKMWTSFVSVQGGCHKYQSSVGWHCDLWGCGYRLAPW